MMDANTIRNFIKDAGVVGAGGAGFPTHVKLAAAADLVIANGAECEPLLRVDQQLMAAHAADLLLGLSLAMQAVGAKRGIVATKHHYHEAVAALEGAIHKTEGAALHLMDSYYPAGDEKSLIYEVCGRIVPTGKLPCDVGVVVCNVNTLVNIARASRGEPVTKKWVTVGGAVDTPATYEVPVGTSAKVLLQWSGAPRSMADYTILVGGPCMGYLTDDAAFPVTKTTGGLIVLPADHPYVRKRREEKRRQIALAKAVCCQCSQCTQLCPRNALGLNVQPHRAMQAVSTGNGKLLGDPNAVLACCSCGLCTNYACNFGLDPAGFMADLKAELGKQGLRPQPEENPVADLAQPQKKVPVARLVARMGLKAYDVPAPMMPAKAVRRVQLPLRQHIGAPARPIVCEGALVREGDLVAVIPEKALGANLHASIAGRVVHVDGDGITIET
ncbi:MAG: 4Fe-4S dicluster domain-containing protein [Clostridiales bacterium]|nr:4Fe-4S dicluster domain-containing protein [Clostridiales bacterium]